MENSITAHWSNGSDARLSPWKCWVQIPHESFNLDINNNSRNVSRKRR